MVSAKALAHRVRQARKAVLRVEVAVVAAQVLFWVTLVAIPVALALRARQRRISFSGRPATADIEPAGEQSADQV